MQRLGSLRESIAQAWANPLLQHARRSKPLPDVNLSGILAGLGGSLLLLVGVAWFLEWRLILAGLMAASIGAVALPLILMAPSGGEWVSRQMFLARSDPRKLTGIDPLDVVKGLSIVILWRLRWPVISAAVFIPVMMMGLLRISLSDMAAWQGSAQAFGEATAAGQARWLLPDGRIPYFRLLMQVVGTGILSLSLLPLLASGGVVAALRLDDLALATLAALLGGLALLLTVGVVWGFLSRTPLIWGVFEALRFVIIVAGFFGLHRLTGAVHRHNAGLLVK